MSRLDKRLIKSFAEVVGKDNVLTEDADCLAYGYDNSRILGKPSAVLFATEHAQVAAIVEHCYNAGIPLIPRGTGTGTTGATVPVGDAIVLSLERMNRIVEIDSANRLARVEPGVANQALQQALAPHGFFWPPDPTSAAICTIGGNLAYNSAGPRAVKYGTPRENTLGLKAVTGTGETIHTGVNTTKGVVGYDLTRLLIGSEGTLAIITEARLRLTPLWQTKRTLRALYKDTRAAAKAVADIMAQAVIPCALEFMDGAAIQMIRRFSDLSLDENVGALLMIEVDGSGHSIDNDTKAVSQAASVTGLIDIDIARTQQEIDLLWKTRKALSPALRNAAPNKINEDVVVPVSKIPDLISGLDELSKRFGIDIINFGHAGNGNIHVNLLYNKEDQGQRAVIGECLEKVFELTLGLGGTLSGEHGVGLVKKDFVDKELDKVSLHLMRQIKKQFDPAGILNPGKCIPAAPE